jgi:uncharacterized membrane protein
MATELWAVVLTVIATIVGALGPVLLKKAAPSIKLSLKSILTNYNLIGGYLLYGVATVIFIPALRGGELSVLYPLVSITYIWVSFLSVRYLGEKMNLLKWSGIGLIMIGVAFIGVGSA